MKSVRAVQIHVALRLRKYGHVTMSVGAMEGVPRQELLREIDRSVWFGASAKMSHFVRILLLPQSLSSSLAG